MPRALNIIVADGAGARVHAALSLAVSAAALDRQVRLFFHGEAVAALSAAHVWPDDDRYRAAGAVTVAELFAQAREMQIDISACETGLHLTGITASGLIPGCVTLGMIGFLAGSGRDAELVTV